MELFQKDNLLLYKYNRFRYILSGHYCPHNEKIVIRNSRTRESAYNLYGATDYTLLVIELRLRCRSPQGWEQTTGLAYNDFG